MLNVFKANLNRLFKNKFFIAGCILAAAITVFFIHNAETVLDVHFRSDEKALELISIGVIAFISIFAPVFQSAEYSNGTIRNKVAMGITQSQIYTAHFLTMVVASIVIVLCWIIGGVIAGISISSWLITYSIRLIFSMIAYSSFMTFIGMRFRKVVTSATMGILAFQGAFMSVIIIFMLISQTFGTTKGIILDYIGNSLAMGRWFANSQLCDPALNLSIIASIILSLVMTAIYYMIGTFKMNKRDLQ